MKRSFYLLIVLALSFIFSAPVAFGGANKVTICHFPNGNDPHTITVSMNAYMAHHIHHGDTMGPCAAPPPPPPCNADLDPDCDGGGDTVG